MDINKQKATSMNEVIHSLLTDPHKMFLMGYLGQRQWWWWQLQQDMRGDVTSCDQ